MKSNKDENSRQNLFEDNLFREALKKVALIQGEKLIKENQDLNTDEIGLPHQKQSEFENRLNKALREKRSRKSFSYLKPIQKVAVIILIISAVASISLFSVDALRIKILNFLMEVRPEYTEFRLDEANNGGDEVQLVNWSNAYIPAYVPEGYKVESSENRDDIKAILFISDDGKIIDYAQYSENSSFNYDTEGASVKDVTVNGNAGKLIVKGNNYSIVWKHENWIFVVMTQISEAETIKMAESIEFTK